MPTWIASGPGSDWQIAIDSRICSFVSHLRSSTSSRSICPTSATGPPKPRNPRRRKYRTNSLIRPPGIVVVVVMSCQPVLSNLDLAAGMNQCRFADAERERQRIFESGDEGDHHQEMQEIIRRAYSAQEQPSPLRRFSTRVSEQYAVSHQHPEQDPVDRPEAGGANRTGIEPRHREQHQNRSGHGGY